MDLTFVTGNAAKARELGRHLRYPVQHADVDVAEVQSLDLDTVVRQKALDAWERLQTPVLVEDTSLVFHALGKLPGPLVKWFLTELGNDGLCRLIEERDRSATARVAFGVCDGHDVEIFVGAMEGTIAEAPRGQLGFGWDPIFIPRERDRTWGEMTDAEKDATSMRKIALTKLRDHLLAMSKS